MDFSLRHLDELKSLYISQYQSDPFCISDWHCDDVDLIVPEFIKAISSTMGEDEHTRYQFADELGATKHNIAYHIRDSASIDTGRDNITFTSTATAALNLLAVAFKEMHVKRLLVVTPVYFSFLDAARRAGLEIIYHHLNPTLGLIIDYHAIKHMIKSQYVDAVYVTRPIYSCGRDFPDEVLLELASICDRYGVWLVCDSTLSGLSWADPVSHSFDAEAIKILSSTAKFALIESPPKKMFLNGLKFGVIYGSPNLINLIDILANTFVGGLMGVQVKFINLFFSREGERESRSAIAANGQALAKKHAALSAITNDTPFELLNVDSGNFGIIIDNSSKLRDVNLASIAKRMLWENNLWIHPLSKFCFFEECKAGFRINYGKDIEVLKHGISCIIKAYPNGLKLE